jgi:hypothetical protein
VNSYFFAPAIDALQNEVALERRQPLAQHDLRRSRLLSPLQFESSARAEHGGIPMGGQPEIGEWYRIRNGDSFEIVAVDDDDRTVEVQYFDGTVEEFDLDDWEGQRANGDIENAEAPEDWSGSVDVEGQDAAPAPNSGYENDQQMAGALDGLDLFETPDSPG